MTVDIRTRAPAPSGLSHVGVAGAVRSAIATMLANAQLARAARRYRSRGSPPIPAYLRRDLGLLPEVFEPKNHWDYR